MFASLAILCAVVLSTTHAALEFKLIDTEAPELDGKECNPICPTLMKMALGGTRLAFTWIMKEVHYSADFCECVITGLDNMEYSEECIGNKDDNVFDHKLQMAFQYPVVNCSCDLPYNPSAAAAKINEGAAPVGKCGKDQLGNKLPKPEIKCDSDGSESTPGDAKPVRLVAQLDHPVLDYFMRIDTRGPEHVFPTKITLHLKEDRPYSLVNGPEFEKAWECINNDENKVPFLQKLFSSAYRAIFDCFDDKNEYSRSIVDTILYYGGNCNNYPSLG